MDRDSLRNLLIAFAVFFLVMTVGTKLLRPPPGAPPSPSGTQDQGAGTGSPATGAESSSAVPTSTREGDAESLAPSPQGATAPTGTTGFTLAEADEERLLVMGTADVGDGGGDPIDSTKESKKDWKKEEYRMHLTVSNLGASIESATMTDHAQEVDRPARYQLLKPIETMDGRRFRSLAIEKINVDGADILLHDRKWHAGEVVETQEGQTVEFWIKVLQDGGDALKLTRTLTLPRQSADSGRHDLNSKLTIEDLSSQAHDVIVTYRGSLGIARANAFRDDRVLDVGILDAGGLVAGSRKNQTDVTKKQSIDLYEAGRGSEAGRLLWAATGNIYFTCTIAPLNPDGTDGAAYIATVSGVDVDGDPLTEGDGTLQFVTRSLTARPGATLAYPAAIYLGEKNAEVFRSNPEYSQRNYYYQIVQGFGWCTFTFLVELMIWLLNGLFSIVRDFGVAIMIMVLIVRMLLHPITKKGQVNMVRMQQRMSELAPKIEEIKKKYANDKARMNQEMMKLNINPAGQLVTCLPMVIQMPIWIALYLSLQNNIQMRHEPFLFTWVNDLTAPDALYTFSTAMTVPLLGWKIPSLNLLPILVAVFMYTQQKLTPKPKPSPSMTDQQRQQQEMMQKMGPMMSIMMLLIFYKMPAGLNLYIMSSSLFGTIEQWRIRKHIKEREEAGTLHKPRGGDDKGPDSGTKASRGPHRPSFWERMQKMAGDAQKNQRTAKAKPRR